MLYVSRKSALAAAYKAIANGLGSTCQITFKGRRDADSLATEWGYEAKLLDNKGRFLCLA